MPAGLMSMELRLECSIVVVGVYYFYLLSLLFLLRMMITAMHRPSQFAAASSVKEMRRNFAKRR